MNLGVQGNTLHGDRSSKRQGARMVETDLREVAFLGRIAAAFTHEMKNVLAIIKESGGLMEDLLFLSQEAPFPYKDRFVRCLATIQAQTKRGVELSNRLNRLAHSPDEEVATVDLNEILEQVVFLSERFARLKGVTLSLNLHEEALNVVVSPMRLQMAVFSCLECCWGSMAAGGNVALSVTRAGKEAIVTFCCRNGVEVAEDPAVTFFDAVAQREIQEMAATFQCRIGCSASAPGLELTLPIVG
jgi:C4-dicarboxylate-specific signal transduction histidine kinase